jgi:hypothetical protein
MSTLENPLWPGTYKITIYVSPPTAQRSGSATVLKYSYDPTTSVSPIRLLSAMPAGVRMTFDRFAYSGFAIGSEDVFDTKNHSICGDFMLDPERRGVLITNFDCLSQDLSQYSCVVACLMPNSVVLSWYL